MDKKDLERSSNYIDVELIQIPWVSEIINMHRLHVRINFKKVYYRKKKLCNSFDADRYSLFPFLESSYITKKKEKKERSYLKWSWLCVLVCNNKKKL